MRRLTIEEGYNRLEWSSALNTTPWFTYSSTPVSYTHLTLPTILLV